LVEKVWMKIGTETMYPTFKLFLTVDFEQYVYLLFFTRLYLSQKVEMKLLSEE
jgi:hypothetical protein